MSDIIQILTAARHQSTQVLEMCAQSKSIPQTAQQFQSS